MSQPQFHQRAFVLYRCISRIFELSAFVQLGLAALKDVAANIELNQLDPYPSIYQEMVPANERSDFYNHQIKWQFPYLFELAIIRLWSIVETAVDEILVDHLTHPFATRDCRQLKDLTVPALEFANADAEDKGQILLASLKQMTRSKSGGGIDRFEYLLQVVRLGGTIHPTVNMVLKELAAVRNALVHKNGRVDAQFVKSCPSFNIAVGSTLDLTILHYRIYTVAVHWYLMELGIRHINRIYRANLYSNLPPRDETHPTDLELQAVALESLQKILSYAESIGYSENTVG